MKRVSHQGSDSFEDVDHARRPGQLVSYLDRVAAAARAYKRTILEMIDPRPGEKLLDVGCGTGDDARQLAELVGPEGHVFGVDQSRTMVDEAKKRCQGANLPLEYRIGDIMRLDFPDASFEGTRAERILQHLRDPTGAVRELVRVTRPGGRVVISEPDWGGVIVNAADRKLTRTLLEYRCDRMTRSGWIGRQLPGLLKEAGLDPIVVRPVAVGTTDFAVADEVFGLQELADAALGSQLISKSDRDHWLSELEDHGNHGTFFSAITVVIVRGEKT
jgi:ubiquinone/menaquinone biosynthesis C-methylase UbiE